MDLEKHFKRRGYTQEEFELAVKTSTSIREVLGKLNIIPAGGNYQIFKSLVSKLNLDTSHFLGHGNNKGKTFGPRRPLEDYLSNSYPIQSNKLRKRLLTEKIFKHECCICTHSTWNNQPIPLELDHINGNHEDNSLSNLRMLCPNCHAQTDTYRGKNIKN